MEEEVLVYDGDNCLIWPYSRGADGYGNLNYDGKVKIVSRLVCELVNGEPPTPEHEAAHSCGKGHEGCVAPNHLSWKTAKENALDKICHGTMPRGETHPASKLSESQVVEIRGLSKTKSHSEIARVYGVDRKTVSLIISRKNWGWLEDRMAA
ncbi:hypothetical protein LB523_11865 [Mesorhizobium sp. ESP-6-4]|uniref:hypothetical protein n=1 Tax=Mesorhizobium sp. ESP-6-4 TaxID=2876624 RepID=UPI001CD0258D|nr:hypothetical protein [Mesorhizobium sp. ESP-6-4]MBZ9659741.1 hypothetical protein [Mesorhizobium sp. ESP-6-4]